MSKKLSTICISETVSAHTSFFSLRDKSRIYRGDHDFRDDHDDRDDRDHDDNAGNVPKNGKVQPIYKRCKD